MEGDLRPSYRLRCLTNGHTPEAEVTALIKTVYRATLGTVDHRRPMT
jgi:hypothetical protein